MSLQVSTKFKELILGTSSFEAIFNGGRILVYSGAQPGSADYAVTGTLLATVTGPGGAGLQFARYGAYVSKDVTQEWRMAVTAAGTAGWFRLVGASADGGGASYSAPRLDGNVGVTGSNDLTLATTTLAVGQSVPFQQFLYTIPPIL